MRRRFPLLAATAVALALSTAAPASGNAFLPPRGDVWHGVAGGSAAAFARETGRTPDVFQTFTTWGSAEYALRTTPRGMPAMLHLSTNRGPGTPEVIDSSQIAAGRGDAWLLRFARAVADRGEPLYLRLFAEMNGPWNAYCAFDADGRARPGHSTRQFRRAWRRIALILRGGPRERIDAKLRRLGMRAVQAGEGPLARAPVALMWVPHNATALDTRANQPRAYWPGNAYVDWVGTDFYGQNPNWGALERIYRDFPGKPFVFGEWALWGRDDPSFVKRVFAFARTHRRVRMLVYNQGGRSNGPFRLKRYPRARRVLRALLS